MDIQALFQTILDWFLDSGIRILSIVIGAFVVQKIARFFVNDAIRKVINHDDAEAEAKRENTLIRIFNGVINIVIWFAVIIMILSEFNVDIGPVLAGAGILGVALGFGAQWMVRDFLAGIFIIWENQYRVGDVVCLGDVCGGVEDITLRKTVLRDLEGKLHHVPNGSFTKTSNLTGDFSRAYMAVLVDYKEDIDKVMEIINRVGKEMTKDSPLKKDILKPIQVLGPGPDGFEESGIKIKVLGETKPLKQWDILREFRRRLKIAFDQEKIEIPFPQMSVSIRGEKKK
ncbi:MAG: mechanosensitive ion channel family protein [bacterium]